MHILIATPAPRGSTRGNRITAERWGRFLRELGHRVTLTNDEILTAKSIPKGHYDLLIGMHAIKSAELVLAFNKQFEGTPIVIAITGTDLYGGQGRNLKKSPEAKLAMDLASKILLIEPEAGKKLKPQWQAKSFVIFQSATPIRQKLEPLRRSFEVTLIGHLREVKDPFLIIDAMRSLPKRSKIHVCHIGNALTLEMKKFAEKQTKHNPRYRWVGPLPSGETKRRMARSQVTLVTSKAEGGPNVISEALVCGVPILTTKIDATVGMLGRNFPGFFPVGDAEQLGQLLQRCENDKQFIRKLKKAGNTVKDRFLPTREKQAWKQLINSF